MKDTTHGGLLAFAHGRARRSGFFCRIARRRRLFGCVQLLALCFLLLQPLSTVQAVYVPDGSNNPYWLPVQRAGPPASPNNATPKLYIKNWQIDDPFTPIRHDGIPAQGVGNIQPTATFTNHWIVEYMSNYYDPSCGTHLVSANALSWEDASLEGIGLQKVPVTGVTIKVGGFTIPQPELPDWVEKHHWGVQQTKTPFDTGY